MKPSFCLKGKIKITFQKGVKFRIYPNRKQCNLIDRTLGCSRLIYNKGLAMREDAFKSGEKCGYKQTSAMLTALKQDVNYAFLKEVDSIALQQALRNLDTGYTNFFEHRATHPKFKSKKSTKQSYRTGSNVCLTSCKTQQLRLLRSGG